MRTKKALINIILSLLMFIIGYIPQFIVRKYFFLILGEDYLGVNSLYSGIIGYLAIAELGIGTAIIYSLYKPYREHNEKIVSQLINFYSKIYRVVGCFILIVGLIISPFIQYLIKDNTINLFDLKICFILYLINTAMSYFFTYKQCLINVAQDSYILSIGNTLSKIAISVFQITGLFLIPDFKVYLVIQIIVNLIYYIYLNYYIDKRFYWIDKNEIQLEPSLKKILIRNIKSLFVHKIGGLMVIGTDNIVLSAFVNLAAVARYNSYNMVLVALQSMFGNAMDTLTPSIGNLLIEKDSNYALRIHDRLFFMTFWMTSIVVTTCWNCLTQFVVLWLGDSQILDWWTLFFIYICVYFALMRTSIEKFKDGSGNFYQDRYAPIFEGILNLVVSIVALKFMGMPGVFFGTFISNFAIIFWTKPYVTYKYVFHVSMRRYYIRYFNYLGVFCINLFLVNMLTAKIAFIYTIWAFILNVTINILVVNLLLFLWFFRSEDFKYYRNLISEKMYVLKKSKHI